MLLIFIIINKLMLSFHRNPDRLLHHVLQKKYTYLSLYRSSYKVCRSLNISFHKTERSLIDLIH